MSLLLDALKRAEQEKLARLEQEAPAEDRALRGKAAGRDGLELEGMVEEVPPPPAAAKRAPDREGAKAVFAAKQADVTPDGTGKNRIILAVGLGALVILAAGGAYVWYEINRTPAPMARFTPPVTAPKPVIPAPVTPAAGSASLPSTGAAPGAAPAATSRGGNFSSAPEPAVAMAAPAPAAPKPRPPSAAEQVVASVLQESAAAEPAPPLELTRRYEAPHVSADVRQGYEALRSGDAKAARGHYEAALAADPASIDAHLGLASAAARAGDRDTAARHYRTALELEPRNPAAVAGLASLSDFTRPEGLEQQLRAVITRSAQSPSLHFALGNLLASQGRWNESQAAYFEAYRLEPDNADYAFNLAVSLDHLGQAKPAADFYQRALAATRQRKAQFDKDQVTRRIAELKP